jgi:hypothetical protein
MGCHSYYLTGAGPPWLLREFAVLGGACGEDFEPLRSDSV